jgi:deazaflavin-dependent oxidoreductase (nitroreductase family)
MTGKRAATANLTDTGLAAHYRAPGWFTRSVFNPAIAGLARRGVSLRGSRVLSVRGRRSGEWRSVPVNPLPFADARYLVAPRGTTEWVRNIRVAGGGELRLGRKAEAFRVRELTDAEKAPVLREYLRRWKAEVGVFFDGVGPDASDETLLAIANRHPVFEVLAA